MGLYIKGMKRPKECTACPSGLSICIGCNAFFTGDRPSGRVREDCPIIEVKTPHGPLKDINEMLALAEESAKEGVGYSLEAVADSCFKTVIEAEVE